MSAYSSSNPGYVKSVNDRLESGAYFKTTGSSRVFKPSSYYSYKAETADSSLKSKITKGAGWRSVSRPKLRSSVNLSAPGANLHRGFPVFLERPLLVFGAETRITKLEQRRPLTCHIRLPTTPLYFESKN